MMSIFGYSPKRIILGFMIFSALISTVIMSIHSSYFTYPNGFCCLIVTF